MPTFHPSSLPSEPVDPANFTGDGTLIRMTGLSDNPKVNAYQVRLEAGARMAWHSHTGVQLLLVTEGTCRFQNEGEPIQQVEPGGIISVEPGVKHWHGAAPDAPMTHIAININASTTWFEKVSDQEYAAPD